MTFRKNKPRCDEPAEMTETEQRLFIMTKLSNPRWRLNHLYKIQNEKGELVTFRMRPAQRQLFRNMHNKNIILKARQLGFPQPLIFIFSTRHYSFRISNAGSSLRINRLPVKFSAQKLLYRLIISLTG